MGRVARIVANGIEVYPAPTDSTSAWLPVVDQLPARTGVQRFAGPSYQLSDDKASVLAVWTVEDVPAEQLNGDTLRSRAAGALVNNVTYLAIVSPSNIQVVAQVNALTKECSALIRLLLNQLDSTAGA